MKSVETKPKEKKKEKEKPKDESLTNFAAVDEVFKNASFEAQFIAWNAFELFFDANDTGNRIHKYFGQTVEAYLDPKRSEKEFDYIEDKTRVDFNLLFAFTAGIKTRVDEC